MVRTDGGSERSLTLLEFGGYRNLKKLAWVSLTPELFTQVKMFSFGRSPPFPIINLVHIEPYLQIHLYPYMSHLTDAFIS